MRNVSLSSGRLAEDDVAGHHDVFGAGRNPPQPQPHRSRALVDIAGDAQIEVFTVVDHRQPERARILHCPPHHARIHDRHAVVGNGHGTGFLHGADLGQLLAFAAFGDGANWEDVDDRVPPRPFHDEAGDGGAVVDRDRVRHATDGAEPSRGGRPRSRLDRFGMLDAGLAQVDVNVDEPRSDDTAGGVMDFRVWGFDLFFDGRDQSVFHHRSPHELSRPGPPCGGR